MTDILKIGEEISDNDEVKERTAIREELSKLSFEDLQKLKEEMGSKLYNEAMFGTKKLKQTQFKRANKNRPREMSSKHPEALNIDFIPKKKTIPRDPRFDSLCGTFNEKAFRHSYSFVKELRTNEKKLLREELKTETNLNRKEKIKYLLQRMENQDKEEERRMRKLEKERKEHEANVQMLKEGKKPKFHKKSEKRVLDLVDQYEELKKKGKLQKHLEKFRKKKASKDRKKLKQAE